MDVEAGRERERERERGRWKAYESNYFHEAPEGEK